MRIDPIAYARGEAQPEPEYSHGRPWTAVMEERLRRDYRKYAARKKLKDLAAELGVTPAALYFKAHRLKIRWPRQGIRQGR